MIKALIFSLAFLSISCKDKKVSTIETENIKTEVSTDTQIETEAGTEVKAATTEAEIEATTEKVNSNKDNQKAPKAKPAVESKSKIVNTKSNNPTPTTNKEVDPKPKAIDKEERPVLPPVYKDPKPKPTDNTTKEVVKEETTKASFNHDDFNKLLSKYVSANGKVNYNSIKANRSSLDDYTKSLMNNPPSNDWSKNERLAYWINAYNAFTITKIVDNYPLKSIKDLDGGKPWDAKWIKIGGQTYSLNNIENDIIRPKFNDPRIHFAVNCAAKSCPPLLNKAYTADNLNSLLDSNAKKFINNSNFNEINSNSLKVSKIFDWYGADFGNLIDYLNKYASTKIDRGTGIDYMEYNWSLNN